MSERDDIDQQAFQQQLDSTDIENDDDPDYAADPAPPPKRKPGGQPGNTNGYLSGITVAARNLKRSARRSRLTVRGRRITAAVHARISDDLGGSENLSETQRILVMITAKQCGRLDRVHRLYHRYANEPKLKNNFGALVKLDAMLRPLEAAVTANLNLLGFKKASRVRDVYDWQNQPGDEDEKTAGDTRRFPNGGE